jgi:hypothetical protein
MSAALRAIAPPPSGSLAKKTEGPPAAKDLSLG